MKTKGLLVMALIALLALASTACGMMSVSSEGGELTITVNLSESQVNRMVGNVYTTNDGDDFLFVDISSVDMMEPDVIRVFGETAEGTSGSYDMTIAAVDGSLRLEVVAVDVPDVTMDDPRVQAANDELEQAFLDNAHTDGEEGGVTDVSVVGDELVFTISPTHN